MPREAAIERHLLRAAVSALLLLAPTGRPALAQQAARPKSAPDKPAQDKTPPEKPAAPSVIGCQSLANYRMLMRRGAGVATATLADPKADHLGCATLPRGRIAGTTDRVALGGQAYVCVGVQGTTACHWMDAGAAPPEPMTGAARR